MTKTLAVDSKVTLKSGAQGYVLGYDGGTLLVNVNMNVVRVPCALIAAEVVEGHVRVKRAGVKRTATPVTAGAKIEAFLNGKWN